jgi:hypothetical protein
VIVDRMFGVVGARVVGRAFAPVGVGIAACAFVPVAAQDTGQAKPPPQLQVVHGGVVHEGVWSRKPDAARSIEGAVVVEGARTVLWAPVDLGREDFVVRCELLMTELAASGAGLRIDMSVFGIDGPEGQLYTGGPLFSGGAMPIAESAGKVKAGVPCEVTVSRSGQWMDCSVNGERVIRAQVGEAQLGRIGIWGGRGAVAVGSFVVQGEIGRHAAPEVLWSAGGDVWDEVVLPSAAMLGDGTVVVSASAVRSDDAGKDVRRILLRVRGSDGVWAEPREDGNAGVPGSDSSLIADGAALHLLVQSGSVLKAMRSGSGGKEWSEPKDVALPSPKGRLAGHGVRIEADGRAMVCVPVSTELEGGGRSVAVMRSADGGASWVAGAALVEPAEAPAMVDLGDGKLGLIAVRPEMAGRWMWTSDDGGATWGAPWSCGGLEPGTTRACAWRQPDGVMWLAESARRAPNALRRWRSDDGGRTWLEQMPVQQTPAGACAVARGADGAVWLVHEGGDFARREHVLVRKIK